MILEAVEEERPAEMQTQRENLLPAVIFFCHAAMLSSWRRDYGSELPLSPISRVAGSLSL